MSIAHHVDRKNTKLSGTRSNSIEYKAIYGLVFSTFFMFECFYSSAQKLAHPLTSLADMNRESPISSAKAAADSSVPYIFRM